MTDQDARLARHVAEAADAWLRDPLDAGVYRRLVDATLAWRAGGGRVVHGTAAAAPDPAGASRSWTSPDAAPDEVDDPDDDARYLRPERAPRAVGSTLADVASMLRARAATTGRDDESKTSTSEPQEGDDHP
ncbi:hypothetical protein ACFWH7_06190 [Cellulosimicrobium cellulans]|uniref:hypothetical protein n=1 Tax=Cellulosimicrobium cellulans TaxID=1710 RepID=UPI003665806D